MIINTIIILSIICLLAVLWKFVLKIYWVAFRYYSADASVGFWIRPVGSLAQVQK